MAPLEILLLNYLSVLFFTVAFGTFIAGTDKKLRSYSIWYWMAQLLLSFVIYKLIQLYDGFKVIYVADFILLASFLIFKIPNSKSNKQNKVNDLAKALPRLHKLNTEEFSVYLTKLFKAYGFHSVKQVKIQNDDPENTYDHYLLARHESSLVEIRIINRTRKLTEKHINEIASNFRDSTSQATSWLLATSAKADPSTNIYIRNSGADIKVFDSKAISDLIYVLAPDHKPNRGIIKTSFIRLLDYLVQKLSSAKNKLTLEQPEISSKAEMVASQQLMSDVLNENVTLAMPDDSLDDENTPPSTVDKTPVNTQDNSDNEQVEEIKPTKKKKAAKSDNQPTQTNTTSVESTPETNTVVASEAVDENENIKNTETEADIQLADSATIEPSIPDVIDENIQVDAEADPLDDLNNIAVGDTPTSVDDAEFDDFKTADTTDIDLMPDTASTEIDLLLVGADPDSTKEDLITADDLNEETPEVQITESLELNDVTVEVEIDPLLEIDVLKETIPVATESIGLDDFPQMAEIDLLAMDSSGSIDLLVGEPSNDKTTSDEPMDPTESIVLPTENAIEEAKLPQPKIELSDLGAALPEQRKTWGNKNT